MFVYANSCHTELTSTVGNKRMMLRYQFPELVSKLGTTSNRVVLVMLYSKNKIISRVTNDGFVMTGALSHANSWKGFPVSRGSNTCCGPQACSEVLGLNPPNPTVQFEHFTGLGASYFKDIEVGI